MVIRDISSTVLRHEAEQIRLYDIGLRRPAFLPHWRIDVWQVGLLGNRHTWHLQHAVLNRRTIENGQLVQRLQPKVIEKLPRRQDVKQGG